MPLGPRAIFAIIWIGWGVSWIAAAFWSNRTAKRAATRDVWAAYVLTLAGGLLLLHSARRLLRETRLWHVGYGGAYVLAALTLAGLLFAWWARLHLGRLWSGRITLKADHRVVDTGPYGLVRHPIYSGLIVSLLATAAAQATPTGLMGVALIVVGLWLKARAEERFLTAELGADAYGAYRRRVPMLIPSISNQ
ncbi:MAG TPA: isoprenylcysteine carboxylmethyltransferase family protein [Xanthobacteraceae bacterium]|nr:isoprenylcysteine carboxylmethyltransferase family protein [Xanthobacteraceae bacterium]